MNPWITGELADFKRIVSDFVKQDVMPLARIIEDTETIPESVIATARDMGLFGITIPEDYDGLGLGVVGKCVVEEELGRGNFAFSTLIGNHTGIGSTGIVELGDEEQKRRYLPAMARGETFAAFALTEPGAGSDAASIRSSAHKSGSGYVLNGEKIFITNAERAGVFTVMARTGDSQGIQGISAFLVERDTPGLRIGPSEKKMGMHGMSTCTLTFENCEISRDALLGQEGKGLSAALRILTKGRVTLAARCIGMAKEVLERTVDYAKTRVQFGKPILENQGIQWMLADIATEIRSAELMTYHTAYRMDSGEDARTDAAMSKLQSSETLGHAVDVAVQVHGGMGYMKDSEIERYYRDARITRIYEGTSEIQRNIIARSLME